jgi:hypothetical protein
MVAQADLCRALRYLLSLYGSSRQPFVTSVKSRDSNILRIHSVFISTYLWSLRRLGKEQAGMKENATSTEISFFVPMKNTLIAKYSLRIEFQWIF